MPILALPPSLPLKLTDIDVHRLERLVLTSNRIECIPPRTPDVDPLLSLKHLSLPFNKLGLWSDIDSLHTWFPALESLALTGNPLAEDRTCELSHTQRHKRPFYQ